MRTIIFMFLMFLAAIVYADNKGEIDDHMGYEPTIYNFCTKKHEPVPSDITDYSCYLQQWPSAQGLYRVYVKMGMEPFDAFVKTVDTIGRLNEK